MKVLFLCEGMTVPASRFRVAQFIPHFQRLGLECDVRFAYDQHYNRWRSSKLGGAYKLLWRLKRIPYAADADEFDLVFIQRPAIPHTSWPERLTASLNPRIVFDFDDSIHIDPSGAVSRARETAMHEIVDLAQWVITGNSFLAELAGAPHKTTVIPTVIDTDQYVPPDRRDDQRLVIGWMGTAGNFPFLEKLVEPVERALEQIPNAVVRIVSNEDFRPWKDNPRVEQIRWSAGNELAMLQSFHIGLMPLIDGPLTKGKCAFKMIQYMAVGCPVVVSAVGANVEVFEGSEAGFCLTEFDEFSDALVELANNSELRRQAGAAGRSRAVEGYSIEAVLPAYVRIFERVAQTGSLREVAE